MSDIYREWGFTENPFQTTALLPNERGNRLLIGRDAEMEKLRKVLRHGPKLVTLEGANGVGKTSLVNIAAYRAFMEHISKGEGPLLIPCGKMFQLKPDQDSDMFVDSVLLEIAQTLIDQAKVIKNSGRSLPSTKALDRWINSPQLNSWQGSIGAATVSFGAGKTSETNTSEGFSRSGLRKEVLGWLNTVFPAEAGGGGLVCTIDNLELLQTSKNVRQSLEQLRDQILLVPGIRWVLCGALGIVQSVASSPRLEGFLHKPIEVAGIDHSHAPQILESRIEAYSAGTDVYMPITPKDFAHLYDVLNRNTRNTMNRLDNYCLWASDQARFETDEVKSAKYHEWLSIEATGALAAVRAQLTPRAWQLFERTIEIGGTFSPSDFQELGFNNQPNLSLHVRSLEEAGLLVSSQDESDKRRKTVQLTPKGWLVKYARG
ncbi:MAG: hypothetical protein EOP84_09180 [Verrucomicrobiaceae bacterium]|nr:MAG: hypothetical protein EOP84_09180 [Verrucomicrobiaceae bacterium]